MMERLKSALNLIFGAAIVILGAILFNRNRKVQSLESEVAKEKANDAIKENEHDRQIARDNADALVDDYERSKR